MVAVCPQLPLRYVGGVMALTTRPEGIARDIKPTSWRWLILYQLKVSAARVDCCDAGSSQAENYFGHLPIINLSQETQRRILLPSVHLSTTRL
jgi:hypothetical protein